MANTMTQKKAGLGASKKKSDDLPPISLPGVMINPGEEVAAPIPAAAKAGLRLKVSDFDDEKLKEQWQKRIDSQRKRFETDVLKVSPTRSKLDPIAKTALDRLPAKLLEEVATNEGPGKPLTPAELEEKVRAFVTRRGLATEVKKVTDRLNARRMTDGRRAVLTATYSYLLAKIFDAEEGGIKKLMKDDLGVADRIMLDLEAEGGPIDVYTNMIVKSVMERNRIKPSETLLKIVSQQVRAAI